MRVARGREADLVRGGCLTIGNFDGLHRGQRRLIEEVVERARRCGGPATLVSFDPHPLAVLDPPRAPARLTTHAQRVELLGELGVDQIWMVPFDRELASLSAERFVREWLIAGVAPRQVLVGAQFRFGHRRLGDLALLERLGGELGFVAAGVAERRHDGETISATRIRALLDRGEVEDAAQLLGRPYAVAGVVVAGDRLGRELGWPTANVRPADPRQLLPAHGVYAAEMRRGDGGGDLPGVANLGLRPTRGAAGSVQLEVHLFDFGREIYGEAVEVLFRRRLRAERRFDNLEALRAQIAIDAENGREYFAGAARLGERRKPAGDPDSGSRNS